MSPMHKRVLPLPPGAVDRRAGARGALLHTLPGRAIVIGFAIKLGVFLIRLAVGPQGSVPTFIAVVDTVAGLVAAVGLTYFAARLIVLAKRRLLWRVRRKLILSYVFIGFVPALLLVAFALLCGFLLFYNFSSYLVQSRLRALADQARFFAQSAALEIQRAGGRDVASIITRRQANAGSQYPDVSIAVVPVDRVCGSAGNPQSDVRNPESAIRNPESDLRDLPSAIRHPPSLVRNPQTAGPWTHLDPPRQLPAWIDCAGFAGVLAYSHRRLITGDDQDTHLLVRSVAFPDSPRPGYAVLVDLLVNDAIRQQLRTDTGVEVKTVTAAPPRDMTAARPLPGRDGGDQHGPASLMTPGILSAVPSLMEYRDWSTGETGALMLTTSLSVAELYDNISAAQGSIGKTFGQSLLLVLFVIGALFLIIEAMALVAGLALAKSLTGSVHALFTGTERVRQGDFTHKIEVKTDDQLGELAGSFNSMTASIEGLLRQAAEKKRLEEELRIAHEIQMSLLPQGPLLMAGLSVTALCVPAREVGGDYYDFLPLGEQRVGVLIADVSGKGTSAALYMAELKGLVLSLSEIHTSPRDLLIAANRIIAHHLDARSFITMTYAVIDLRARTMTYARAGHTPLIYVPGAGADGAPRQVQILAPDGMVVGLKLDNGEMFARHLVEETIALQPGDLYLLFTDGISEAMNAGDDLFGETRLGQLVETHSHLSSEELRERMLREIAAFVGDAPQHDDMTMILVKVDEIGVGPATISPQLAGSAEIR
jgi:serine phosphatase RsbU (regulator of sigma subunit)